MNILINGGCGFIGIDLIGYPRIDVTKSKRMLGFEPEYDLRMGLEETFTWFIKNQRK